MKKKICGQLEKDVFKVINPNKVVISENILSITQVFNYCFVNKIKDSCTNKAYEKCCLVVYTYNKKEKIHMLMNLPKRA